MNSTETLPQSKLLGHVWHFSLKALESHSAKQKTGHTSLQLTAGYPALLIKQKTGPQTQYDQRTHDYGDGHHPYPGIELFGICQEMFC